MNAEMIIGNSLVMQEAHRKATLLASRDITVLVTGPSGSGKELMARCVHNNSRRATGPFIAINCGAIPESLIDSEFFGHERGSFTGAISRRHGVFEQAEGGTIFLDEIGEMSSSAQVKILRTIENREIRRVGGMNTITVNVRIICATNADIHPSNTTKFREDLYYRISGAQLKLPSLQERKNDIPVLVQYFIALANKVYGCNIEGIAGDAMEILQNYSWPGNIRELSNVVGAMVALNDRPDKKLAVTDIPLDIYQYHIPKKPVNLPEITNPEAEFQLLPSRLPEDMNMRVYVDMYKRRLVEVAMERVNRNQSQAAKLLRVDRSSIRRMLALENASSVPEDDVKLS